MSDYLGDKFIILDGAMGTMLQKQGLKPKDVPEAFNIERPEIIAKIHKEYIDAGADIITTNTFGANELKLSSCPYTVELVVQAGVKIAKKVADGKKVALDIGPIGEILEPVGQLSFERAYEIFKRQVKAGTSQGADIALIETMSDLYEMKAAILAVKENSNLPVFATMTFQKDKRTLMGTDPKTMVFVLEGLGVDALGVNCSLGPKELQPVVDEILKYSSIPVIVQPNAGLPKQQKGKIFYDLTPDEFCVEILEMAKKGVSIFGGCCGTDPEYIRAIADRLQSLKPVMTKPKDFTTVCSSTKTVFIDGNIQIVGEKLNPSGKPHLKRALKEMDINYIINEAISQQRHGAHILDVNAGMPHIDETSVMLEMIKQIQGAVNLPLQIDSTNPQVIEKAARAYNGKPIINSVNGKKDVMERIFPIAKKYGAAVIGLTMDENGIPKSSKKRLEICEKILKTAQSYGIDKKDIIIDCLTLTASAEQAQVFETLKAMREIKEKYGVKTILGISNISYGLPQRKLLNKTFLIMAATFGLDLALINPEDEEMIDAIRSFRVLANMDKGAKEYIKYYSGQEKDLKPKPQTAQKSMREIILDGLKGEIEQSTKQLLNTNKPLEIVNNHIIPALDEVGEKYEKGDIFLPQLIQSAETVKLSFDVIKKAIKQNDGKDISKGKIILATVEGDVHDIGKNIVKVLLENYGYEVIDLGKDVPAEVVVQKISEYGVKLVGLSALMTTTVANMKKTIDMVKQEKMDCSIMVGGAVLNREYARQIGADYYGKDARDAVKIAKNVFSFESLI